MPARYLLQSSGFDLGAHMEARISAASGAGAAPEQKKRKDAEGDGVAKKSAAKKKPAAKKPAAKKEAPKAKAKAAAATKRAAAKPAAKRTTKRTRK